MSHIISFPLCPCGSRRAFSKCCEPHFDLLGIKARDQKPETSLLDWLNICSPPITVSFLKKAGAYVFRVSSYLDSFIDLYLPFGFEGECQDPTAASEAIVSIKHNALLSSFASLSCLSQGLFMQSGCILRSMLEDCLVLVDLFENPGQMDRFLQGKYSTKRICTRVKKLVPDDVVTWHGYFSANFAHCGPLHPAPYIPRACYPENFVLVLGLQDIVRAIVAFHIVLERSYFTKTNNTIFWKHKKPTDNLLFNRENPVFVWANRLGEEVVSQYPPDQRKDGFSYDTRGYRTK